MIPTDFLLRLADYEGIVIEWRNMHHVQGIHTYTPKVSSVIALSNALHTKERRLRFVLAHELGAPLRNCRTNIMAASSTSSVYAIKHEHLATKWAVDLLIPTDVFLEHVKRGANGQHLTDFHATRDSIRFNCELIKKDECRSDIIAKLKTSYNVVF